VVEFWATWCGPCRATIPHLTELQKKHKDVTFIGVSVWETDQKAVKPFVQEMKEKMNYRVAMDAALGSDKEGTGTMAKTWMDAAGQDGIPTAFIVDRDGKIAWVGHPMNMEQPLDEILEGKWDLQAAANTFKKEMVEKRKLRELMEKITKARSSGDSKALLAILDEAIAGDAKLEPQIGRMKFNALASDAANQDKAWDYGRHFVESVINDKAQNLNRFAWEMVDPAAKKKLEPRFLKLALQAAKRADELTDGKDPAVADTLARAYFLNGDHAKALEVQERAVQAAKGTPLQQDKEMKERLQEYRKAVKQ
jgi:hypothetical protein